MTESDPKADLRRYLQAAREALVWKLDGLSEYDARRPLALDAFGKVPWWPRERREVTLQRILARMIAETHRHAGHADILRELIDGAVGLREGNDNMAPGDQAWWERYRSRLERAAREAGDNPRI
jgi:Protein of unknown function (DUF664)